MISTSVHRPSRHTKQTPLIVDPDTMLTGTRAFQCFQTICRRDPHVFQALGGVQHTQLATGDRLNLDGKTGRSLAAPNAFGFLVCEVTDHVGL
jgi:hypothetical protein